MGVGVEVGWDQGWGARQGLLQISDRREHGAGDRPKTEMSGCGIAHEASIGGCIEPLLFCN